MNKKIRLLKSVERALRKIAASLPLNNFASVRSAICAALSVAEDTLKETTKTERNKAIIETASRAGKGGVSFREILSATHIPGQTAEDLLSELEKAGLITRLAIKPKRGPTGVKFFKVED